MQTDLFMLVSAGAALAQWTPAQRGVCTGLWRSLDGARGLAYAQNLPAQGAGWQLLSEGQILAGASDQADAAFHYVVMTDIEPGVEEEFNAWYATEHLPGLARVPGTLCARRFVQHSASPRYVACYDLESPQVLERPEWLAVRHTPWSSRIRPFFRNTQRVMYQRVA